MSYPKLIHYTFQGLPIAVESAKGTFRHWKDPNDGTAGKTEMLYDYGYIKGTTGTDDDAVDAYIGPNKDSTKVYVVLQKRAPKFVENDENKCMLGFDTAAEAKKAYLAHYNNPKFFGSMKEFDLETFREKLKSSDGHLIKAVLQGIMASMTKSLILDINRDESNTRAQTTINKRLAQETLPMSKLSDKVSKSMDSGTELLKALTGRMLAPVKPRTVVGTKHPTVPQEDAYKAGIAREQPLIGTNRAVSAFEPVHVPARHIEAPPAPFRMEAIVDPCAVHGMYKSVQGKCPGCIQNSSITEAVPFWRR